MEDYYTQKRPDYSAWSFKNGQYESYISLLFKGIQVQYMDVSLGLRLVVEIDCKVVIGDDSSEYTFEESQFSPRQLGSELNDSLWDTIKGMIDIPHEKILKSKLNMTDAFSQFIADNIQSYESVRII